MAKGLVARRLASLLSKSVRHYERYPDAGGRVPNEGLRLGRGIIEAGQRIFAKSNVHREKRSQMEYSSRVFARGLESQEFTYPDEYTRRQGLHNFYRVLYITLERENVR